ncbi:MAG: site-specific integrase [Pirellulales bacterium]
MASIANDQGGRRRIQFVAADGSRKAVRLGKVSQRFAEGVKLRIEHLLAAKLTGQAPDADTSRWVAGLDASLAEKLAAVGLVPRTERPTIALLGPFLTDYTARRIDVKPATKEVWQQVVRNLIDHFGAGRALAEISEGDAEDFKLFLISEKLAPTTVHKRLQFARMFFRAAKKRKLATINPFAEVSAKAVLRADRQHFVSREATERVLAVCNPTWRTIIGLARYGGLRCPSEVLSVRWQDIDREAGRIVVQSPKTEHHPGKGTRTIPLFPELRTILADAFEQAADGAEYVVDADYREAADTKRGWRSCNLRTQFERLLKRAGLQPWPRLFHALRASRETELAADYPIHVVTSWLGNTPRIALKHYLQVTDTDYDRANARTEERGAECGALAAQNAAQQAHAENRRESPEPSQTPSEFGTCGTFSEGVREFAEAPSGEDRIRTCGPV